MASITADPVGTVGYPWGPNRTYPAPPTEGAVDNVGILAMLDFGARTRTTVHLFGSHGIGKSSIIRMWAELRGWKVVNINLANITLDDKMITTPLRLPDGGLALRTILMKDLTPGVPFILNFEESMRATPQLRNQFMQVFNEWELLGAPMEDLMAVVLSDNEGQAEGIRHSEDLALADRKVTVQVTANETGWRYALAAKFPDEDLAGAFAVWDTLPPELRFTLSPRALEHVLYCVFAGIPAINALPLVGSKRMRLVDKAGNDRTEQILGDIARAVGRTDRDHIPDLVAQVVSLALRDRLAVYIEGPPGVGKTAVTKALITQAGYRCAYRSIPTSSPERFIVPVPVDGELIPLVDEELATGTPYVAVWDEINRPTSPAVFSKLMEILHDWTIGDVPLDLMRAQIALGNPTEWMGRKMSVSKGTVAFADRFTISVQITESDIAANEWLLSEWPATVADTPERQETAKAVMTQVLEWWKTDIGEEHRQWISKRTLVRLANLHLSGLPLEHGKIYLGEGEYAPVPLVDLEARLANRPMTRLGEIASNLDAWQERLKAASETSAVGSNDTDVVHQALTLAEVSQLREHATAVLALFPLLPPKLRVTFFTGPAEQKEFWMQAVHVLQGKAPASSLTTGK